MAPSLIEDDYYEILCITQTADEAAIKASYRRLAKLRHPDRNRNNPNATADFQRLNAAHSTLIDSLKRKEYDVHYPSIRSRRQNASNHDSPFHSRFPTQSDNHASGRSADDESWRLKKRIQELEKAHQELINKKEGLLYEMSEARRNMENCKEALSKLQEEENDDISQEAVRNGWFNYIFGKRESSDEKEARERRATERRTGRLVRQAEFDRHKARYDAFDLRIAHLTEEISKVILNIATERRQEKFWQEEVMRAQERRRREKQKAERRQREAENAKVQEEILKKERLRKEQEAREARARWLEEQKRQEEQRQAEQRRRDEWKRQNEAALEKLMEDVRKAQGEIRRVAQRQADEKLETLRREQETQDVRTRRTGEISGRGLKNEEKAQDNTRRSGRKKQKAQTDESSSCSHKKWWDKVKGKRVCEWCHKPTTRFAFQCPGCYTVACAECRRVLQGKGGDGK